MTRRRGAPPHERACRLGAGCRCARPPPGSPLRSDPAPRGAGGDLDPVSAHRRGAITGSRPRPATQLARHDHDENRPGRLHLSKARFWSERWGPPQPEPLCLDRHGGFHRRQTGALSSDPREDSAALYSSKNNQAAQEKTVQLIRGHYTRGLHGLGGSVAGRAQERSCRGQLFQVLRTRDAVVQHLHSS